MFHTTVSARLDQVRARVTAACLRAGRDPAEVTLVAVSKLHPVELIREAYSAGQRDFGENYVQELTAKRRALEDLTDLRWHFIGHLQSNKARELSPFVQCVHTVDSPKLARELDRRVRQCNRVVDVLVQVNVGGEEQKSGCAPGLLGSVLDAVTDCSSLRLRGLMTVPPHTVDPSLSAVFFDSLRTLRDTHGGPSRLPQLSMGMTHDLEPAIASGATIVRIGTAIFGERS